MNNPMPQHEPSLIEVNELSFKRGKRVIYENVSLKIRRGQITAIMGPSGTGKTTLLRLIGGQLTPDHGDIFLDGQNVSLQELETKLQDAAQASQKPTVQLEADEESKYNMVAKVMALASSAGLSDIAFVSEN